VILMDAALQVVRNNPARLAASSKFGRFGPETENAIRTQKVENNPALEGMRRVWTECKDLGCERDDVHDGYDENYVQVLRKIKKFKYSAQDVEEFSLGLDEFQREENFRKKAGLFLSALINNCKGREFVVHTENLTTRIDYIGYRNKKNITVEGPAGDCLGRSMKGGTIIVNGYALGHVGHTMKRGTIIVNGDAYDDIGFRMRGGTIIVKGNAANSVGFGMDGGKITIEGNTGYWFGTRMEGGEIYLLGRHGYIDIGYQHGEFYPRGKIFFHKEEQAPSKWFAWIR